MYRHEKDDLSVVSYNIHKGLSVGNLRVALARMRTALRTLGPDVVLVQEVVGNHRGFGRRYRDWPGGAQFEFLADGMWPHFAYGRNAVHADGDHGNAVLSRFPITRIDNIDISLNRFEQRGVLHVEIDVPTFAARLHVCCTHLNLLHGQRRRQLAALAKRVRDTVPEKSPLIVGGDFNDWRTAATVALRDSIGVAEAYVEVHGRHARTFPGWHPVLPLDRIYVRGLEVVRAEVLDGPAWRSLSDHLGVHVLLNPRSGSARSARCP